jgi:hypothetical protein
VAYDVAAEQQVTHGEGFVRVLTEYASDTSFDQEIIISPVMNPFRVHMDPDRLDPVGSDAQWVIIDDDMSEDEFKRSYPKAEAVDWTHDTDGVWFQDSKRIMIAEVFSVEREEAKLYLWGNGATSFDGEPLPQGVFIGEKPLKTRTAFKRKVMWRKISGKEVLEEREFPCQYIPIARVVGNEWEVDGKKIVSGLVRGAKDSQRMYNVAQSAIVERVLQSPKTPWAAPAEAVEGLQQSFVTPLRYFYAPVLNKDYRFRLAPGAFRRANRFFFLLSIGRGSDFL